MLAEVAQLASNVHLARGETLFRAGRAGRCACTWCASGTSRCSRRDDGRERTINTLTRGAVLGELALLSDSARSASVRALRDSELLRIERSGFEALLRSEPELTLSLARVAERPVAGQPRDPVRDVAPGR